MTKFCVLYGTWTTMVSYEVKQILCLLESPFKIQNNGVFLFEISYFVLEILTFYYYAN